MAYDRSCTFKNVFDIGVDIDDPAQKMAPRFQYGAISVSIGTCLVYRG